MALPLVILTTGDPVPQAEEKRGSFYRLIREGVGDSFSGEVLNIHSLKSPIYPDPREVAGIIVSGSPARLNDQEAWMLETEEALRNAHRVGTPILGICFGHQLLGEALGGTVRPNPNGREIGTIPLVKHAPDPLFDGICTEETVVMTHLDSVVVRPPGSVVLRSTPQEPHAALRFSDTTWGVQFHPEMDSEVMTYYLEARRSCMVKEGLDVDAILEGKVDSPFGRQLLRRFGAFCERGTFE